MNSVEEVLQVISISLIFATFLLNTNRILKALQLCKECLFILKDRAGIKDQELTKSLYLIMWKACNRIGDNKNAIKHAEKLLQIYRLSGESLEEYKLRRYLHQRKHVQAMQLSEKELLISKELGDKNGEAICYTNLGNMYQSVGEYDKAREHLENSVVIQKEIGDRNGEAFSYANLGAVYQLVGEYEKARKYLEKSLVISKELGDTEK